MSMRILYCCFLSTVLYTKRELYEVIDSSLIFTSISSSSIGRSSYQLTLTNTNCEEEQIRNDFISRSCLSASHCLHLIHPNRYEGSWSTYHHPSHICHHQAEINRNDNAWALDQISRRVCTFDVRNGECSTTISSIYMCMFCVCVSWGSDWIQIRVVLFDRLFCYPLRIGLENSGKSLCYVRFLIHWKTWREHSSQRLRALTVSFPPHVVPIRCHSAFHVVIPMDGSVPIFPFSRKGHRLKSKILSLRSRMSQQYSCSSSRVRPPVLSVSYSAPQHICTSFRW